MEEENITIDYCRKVRFYPTLNHKILFEKCFGATRYLVNQAIEAINNKKLVATSNNVTIRNYLRYQDKYLTEENDWLKEIPYDTRDGAIIQLASNYKTGFTQIKNKTINHFEMKFKTKKNTKQIFFAPKTALRRYKKLFINRVSDDLVFKENIEDFEHGIITVVRENGCYYMCFPLKKKSENISTPYKSISLDPGVRTFQTFYSEEGLVGKIGSGIDIVLKKINKIVDKLHSKRTSVSNKRTRYNINRKCKLLRTKVKNIVNELHRKTCHWLTTNFKYVFLPEFNVKPMIVKQQQTRKLNNRRPISKITVRSMLALSHYSFKQRLLHMAKTRGCVVNICNESHTTKTCGCCGHINWELRDEEIYNCFICDTIIDRDYNAARNIYLKNIQ